MKPGAFVLVAMVSPQSVPEEFRRRRLEWPLHVTVLPWFTVPDVAKFVQFLRTHLSSEPAFEAVMGDDAVFGLDGKTPVTLVKNRQSFAVLHNYVFEIVAGLGGEVLVNTWIHEKYTPHVTHHGDSRLFAGDAFMVQSLTLVKLLEDDICQVVETFRLGEKK